MRTLSKLRRKALTALCLLGVAAVVSACAPSDMIPGNSYTKANSSLAIQSWEATAVLALASAPSCEKHNLINTEVMSVQEPLKIEG